MIYDWRYNPEWTKPGIIEKQWDAIKDLPLGEVELIYRKFTAEGETTSSGPAYDTECVDIVEVVI